MTENLPLNLPEGVEYIYIDQFVERILEAVQQPALQELQQSELIWMLPGLLRAFALRVAFSERTEEGRAAGVFTRRNKDRITNELLRRLQPAHLNDVASDRGSIISAPDRPTGEPEMDFREKAQQWFVVDEEADDICQGEEDSGEGVKEQQSVHVDPNVIFEPTLSEMDAKRVDFAVGTTLFSWLLKAVTNRLQLDYCTADVFDSVHELASTYLGQQRENKALRSHRVGVRVA
ncbi:hypothetical protein OQA88_7728 [Cercophora sp. LCS_1]